MQSVVRETFDIADSVRLTPLPPFDPEVFARESELHLLARNACKTLPPPPLYPASFKEGAPAGALTERVSVTLQSCLRDAARRAALLASTLRMGALSREEATRALRLELDTIEAAADGSRADSVSAIVASLRDLIEEIGGIAGESPAPPWEVVVLDTSVETASFIALALESHGHRARVATSLEDLGLARDADDEVGVDAVFVAIDHPEANPDVPFSRTLREVAGCEGLPIVLYGRAPQDRLASLAARAEADCALRIDTGVDEFLEAVGALLERLPWSRRAHNDS